MFSFFPRSTARGSNPRAGRRSGGFTLIEVVIAAVMFLAVAVGILPLFVRAVGLNHEGRLATFAAHYAASEIERLAALPFDAPELTIAEADVENEIEQYQALPNGPWVDDTEWSGEQGFTYHRIVRVRQFGLAALSDGVLDRSEALSGSISASTPGLVQLKEILVQVESGKVPGAARRSVTLRYLKAI